MRVACVFTSLEQGRHQRSWTIEAPFAHEIEGEVLLSLSLDTKVLSMGVSLPEVSWSWTRISLLAEEQHKVLEALGISSFVPAPLEATLWRPHTDSLGGIVLIHHVAQNVCVSTQEVRALLDSGTLPTVYVELCTGQKLRDTST